MTQSARWRARFTLTVSSCCGLGYLPLAPGTWGTLGALPLWYAMRNFSWPLFCGVSCLVTAVAIWAAGGAEKIYQSHDVGHIVIDEVAGLLFTVVGVPWRWPEIVAAFILFRILDAAKPFPISWLDRNVSGGFGVVIDDVVAGLVGCGILHGAKMILGGWW